jgi:hypothetical protein
MTGSFYIIEAENGRIKFGWTGCKPLIRARSIRNGSPCPTRLVAVVESTIEQEKALHAMLAPWRLWGEWYQLSPPLEAYVRSLFGIGVDRIPEWSEIESEESLTISERISRGVRASVARRAHQRRHSHSQTAKKAKSAKIAMTAAKNAALASVSSLTNVTPEMKCGLHLRRPSPLPRAAEMEGSFS